EEAKKLGVQIVKGMDVIQLEKFATGFTVHIQNKEPIQCKKLLIATGSSRKMYSILEDLGHSIEPLVPSLFTFNVPTSPLLELAGVAAQKVHLKLLKLEQTGPLLITHWGFSGPAVLKLSAWGAKELHAQEYKATLYINWLADHPPNTTQETLQKC